MKHTDMQTGTARNRGASDTDSLRDIINCGVSVICG